MSEQGHQRLSFWLLVVAVIALVVALAPTFYCAGERVVLCEDGYWLGKALRVGARGAWLVLMVSGIGGMLLRMLGGSERSGFAVVEESLEFVQPAAVSSSAVIESIALDTSLEFRAVVEGGEPELEEDPDSVMAFVQDAVAREQAGRLGEAEVGESSMTADGFYCPPGMEKSLVLYVDGRNEGFESAWEDGDRLGDRARAFGTIGHAVRFARTLVFGTDERVQIRILPGVYSCGVQVPDRVVLLNDRMPAGQSLEWYTDWLAEQQEIGHLERVTLHADADVEHAIVFLPGRMQGLYGCYVVGRDGVEQSGIRAAGCHLLRIFCCVIECFSKHGMELSTCGSDMPGSPIEVIGSVLRSNSSREGGGALYVYDSALRIEECLFENNRAELGGAIRARNLKAPLLLKRCKLRRNRALGRRMTGDAIRQLGLETWKELSGLGGAVLLENSRLKIVDSRFDVNDAVLGGGAIAVLGSRVAVECSLEQMFVQNRAKIGGAVLAVGWMRAPSAVKACGVVFQSCQAQHYGGGLALVGLTTAQLKGGHFYANHCADPGGAGGAVVVLKGAVLSTVDERFSNNMSDGDGGALAVINATLRMSQQCTIKENEANGEGGGIYCVTEPDAEMERLVHEPDFSGPFALQLKELRICGNRSGGDGSGLRVGNHSGYATFPMKIDMLDSVHVYENFSEGGGAQTVVKWAGEERGEEGDSGALKVLLG